MIIGYKKIEFLINTYIDGGIFTGLDDYKASLMSREFLMSSGFESTGIPEEHELFERHYSTKYKNQGVILKIYMLAGMVWSSGVDFYGFRLKNIIKRINKKTVMQVFVDEEKENGALIVNNLCVCRFSLIAKHPFALTFETDVSLVEEMRNHKIPTSSVKNNFRIVKHEELSDKKLKNLKKIMSSSKHEFSYMD